MAKKFVIFFRIKIFYKTYQPIFSIASQYVHILRVAEVIIMNDKFLCGMVLGFMVGAIVMHVNPKAQELLEKGKEEVKKVIDKI